MKSERIRVDGHLRPVDYRTSHLDKSLDYHSNFTELAHQALLWRLEQRVLREVIASYFPLERPRHLDFACGTGRVLTFLGPLCCESTGIDVSASMLEVAASNSPQAELLLSDITSENQLSGRTFDVITAFRFFPNAEDPLRMDVVAALAPLLSERGILILNNHLNSSSLSRAVLRASGRRLGHSMRSSEVVSLLTRHGLEVLMVAGVGFLPLADRHVVIAPHIAERLERTLTRAHRCIALAQNQIFVATRSSLVRV